MARASGIQDSKQDSESSDHQQGWKLIGWYCSVWRRVTWMEKVMSDFNLSLTDVASLMCPVSVHYEIHYGIRNSVRGNTPVINQVPTSVQRWCTQQSSSTYCYSCLRLFRNSVFVLSIPHLIVHTKITQRQADGRLINLLASDSMSAY